MPRAARMVAPNMVYHVISRGNDRQWVFNDREDFDWWRTRRITLGPVTGSMRTENMTGLRINMMFMNHSVRSLFKERGPTGTMCSPVETGRSRN